MTVLVNSGIPMVIPVVGCKSVIITGILKAPKINNTPLQRAANAVLVLS
jgi:hypothetical protein